MYVIAIPANRYDLLCLEGFARAIRIFLGVENPPVSFWLQIKYDSTSVIDVFDMIFFSFTRKSTQPKGK